ILPELDPVRDHPEARPELRARNLAQPEFRRKLGDAPLQLEARGERPRLARRPGSDPAAAGPAGEIGIRLRSGDLLHRSLDTDLALERFPVEQQRRTRIDREIASLATLAVSVEDEAAAIDALEEYHPDRRPALGVGGRHGHGVGIVRFTFLR